MKKNLVFILCLSLIFILVGCNSDKKATQSTKTTNEQNTVDEKKETDSNNKVKLYEGTYLDERYYGDDILKLKNYCNVVISNVTNTSFDFTVYEVDRETENKKVIFLTNTAVFTEYGKNYTLNFTFPNISDIEISGFKPLEGQTYMNNRIPGYECS